MLGRFCVGGGAACDADITQGVAERSPANTASAVERINSERLNETKLKALAELRIMSPLISLQVMKF
jgi:hypothetical protein